MRILSTTACTGRTFEEFLEIYQILKDPLNLQGLEVAIGIPFTIDDIPKIKQADIDTVIWHDAFWFLEGRKQETYPDTIARYFELHALFSANDINVPLWSIHPYKSHKPSAVWTDEIYSEFCQENWSNLEYVLPRDNVEDSDYYWQARDFMICFENMLPTAPCYNNLQAVLDANVPFCIDYSHINIWTRNNREQTIIECLLASRKASEIHLSHNNGRADSHDYIPSDAWFIPYLDLIEKKTRFITYESLPVEFRQYGRLDKK